MDNLENKLNSILGNPEMMKQIMAIAQNFDSEPVNEDQAAPTLTSQILPNIDLQTIQKISSIIGDSNIDHNQKNLLSALSPYLSKNRISKLEKAMRAAKIAQLASSFITR